MGPAEPGPDETPPTRDPSVFVQMFVDAELWNRAHWVGVGYRTDEYEPPWLFLLFKNDRAAKEIFEHWLGRIGRVDRYDEIRVSIVEGDIPGKEPGYSVTVGSDPSHTAKRFYDECGEDLDVSTAVVISRAYRMNPTPGSPHLSRFKSALSRDRCFDLLPATLVAEGIELHDALSIRKQVVHLRMAELLEPNDVDSIVL